MKTTPPIRYKLRQFPRKSLKLNGARERTRTSTSLRILEPESSASTNSATRALKTGKPGGVEEQAGAGNATLNLKKFHSEDQLEDLIEFWGEFFAI